jgi:porphobilinogen deaminase
MKTMECKQKYKKEFVSAVSVFVIFIAFMTHIAILPAKSCIAWSTLRRFKQVTHKGPRVHQREARGPDIRKQGEG